MKKIAIKCESVSKEYILFKNEFEKIKTLLLSYEPSKFVALKNINFEIYKGEIIGIVGTNGSGKSTISNIISGLSTQTEGKLEVDGSVNILAVNAGMDVKLTGIENIYYKCMLLGIEKKEVERIKEQIIDFAEIGVHIDHPVSTYSSGMKARLGFAISINITPDILIVDEALSVGDNSFAEKCKNKMNEIKESGRTVVYISHSIQTMYNFCDRVLWLHKGSIVGFDKPECILPTYLEFNKTYSKLSIQEKKKYIPIYKNDK